MIKKLLVGFVIALIALVIVIQLRPADFRISRTGTIAGPPDAVFAQVNDFHAWEKWSPWAKMDPDAKNTFAGPASGVGATFSWDGNNKVGSGTMKITESKPSELVRLNLDFTKPMQASNLTEFTFKPEGGNTVVTWTMSGKNGFMGKAFSLFVDCDKMVGGDFEKGLASMKSIVEGAAKK